MADRVVVPKPEGDHPWDVVIIGSGPSALTAAIYTTRGFASTLILSGEKWGGQLMLTTDVDNFPSQPGVQGPDLMRKMRDHAVLFGAEFIEKNVESVDFSTKPMEVVADSKLYKARSVIIATGAQTNWLEVPGEDKLRGRGVSSCAPCDAPFFKNKKVLVVGGGDSAMEEASVLAKYASKVIVAHRRTEFRASQAMQQRVFGLVDKGLVEIIWDTSVNEIFGEDYVTGVSFSTSKGTQQEAKLRQEHSDKIKSEDSEKIVWEDSFDGVFVAIGHSPSTEVFTGNIELDKKGYVVKKPRNSYQTATTKKGVFVAGDVHDYNYRQAITAAGFGCMAGMDVLKYLEEEKDS